MILTRLGRHEVAVCPPSHKRDVRGRDRTVTSTGLLTAKLAAPGPGGYSETLAHSQNKSSHTNSHFASGSMSMALVTPYPGHTLQYLNSELK